MIRDITRLANQLFDVIVVGAGIYGLMIAWDLALRGIHVALVERDDFSAATSFNSLKTVHGGVRPLQHGAIAETRRFVRERRAVARMAPHLVRPLPFMIPTYRHPIRNRPAMAAFLAAYDRIAHDRNDGMDPSRVLPRSRTFGRDEALRLNPLAEPAGITGGALWHDYQLHSPERFAIALLLSMERADAVPINYAAVRQIVVTAGRVCGIRGQDRETGTEFEAHTSVVVNAAGPWAYQLARAAGGFRESSPAHRFSLAMNLVLRHPPLPHAVGGLSQGRFLFMVPWRERSIVGTSHDEHPDALTRDGVAAAPELRDALLRDAREAFPRAELSIDGLALVHRGLLPAGPRPGTLLKHTIIHDHAADRLSGLLTVVGVRYTTARATAERVGDAVCVVLGRHGVPSRTAETPLAGADMSNVAAFHHEAAASSSLPRPVVDRLVAAYGTDYRTIDELVDADQSLGLSLSPDCTVTRAEILHSARREMAVHLTDALLRRTAAGAGGHPGTSAIAAAADIMAGECSWTPERRLEEIASVEDFYRRNGA